MLRVRPGVLLVRASFAPTNALIRLDLPTFDRPRKAISGTPGAGKWFKSLADNMNRARIRIQTVSRVEEAHGKHGNRKIYLSPAPLQSKVKNGGRGRPPYTPIPACLRSAGMPRQPAPPLP